MTDVIETLTGPTPDEIQTGLTTFSATARENVFQAINILNEADTAQDIANAILHLENTQGQIEVLEQAIPMIVGAAQTLQQVALTLRDQRDEAIGQRDEAAAGEDRAKRFAHAAFDEGLAHIWECSDCFSSLWDHIMENFPEDIMQQVDEIEGHLSPAQIAPLKRAATTLEVALESYFTEKRKAEKLIDEAEKPEHKYIIRDAKTGETMEIDRDKTNPNDLLLDAIDDGFYDDEEDTDINAIKGVNEHGYPILASEIRLPRNHPLPLWCECGAPLPWVDLGALEYKYPDRKWHVFICGVCGKHTASFPVRR